MQRISKKKLETISARIDPLKGWDFSNVKFFRDKVPWNYHDVVIRYSQLDFKLIDIGTGGGEIFLDFAPTFETGIGIDKNFSMLENASQLARSSNNKNSYFSQMHSGKLGIATQSKDLILCKHASFEISEIIRCLKPNGIFITQQVGRNNTKKICEIFECGTYGEIPIDTGYGLNEIGKIFIEKGCRILEKGEYDVDYFFLDLESMLFWLQAIPIPHDFNLETHWEQVAKIVDSYDSTKGIRSNEHREYLVIESPSTIGKFV